MFEPNIEEPLFIKVVAFLSLCVLVTLVYIGLQILFVTADSRDMLRDIYLEINP